MKYLYTLLLLIILTSCRSTSVVTNTEYVYVDTTVWRDTTIYVPVPYEKERNVVPSLDTLHLSTSVASAKAWLDTATCTLQGEIENNPAEIQYKTKWRDRVITRTNTVTKTKTVTKTRAPKWCFFFLGAVLIYCLLKCIS